MTLPKTLIEADSLTYVLAHLRNSNSLSYQPRRILNASDIAEIAVADATVGFPFRIVAGHAKTHPLSPGARRLLAELESFLHNTVDLQRLTAFAPPASLTAAEMA